MRGGVSRLLEFWTVDQHLLVCVFLWQKRIYGGTVVKPILQFPPIMNKLIIVIKTSKQNSYICIYKTIYIYIFKLPNP